MQRKDYKRDFANAVCTLSFVLVLTCIVVWKNYFYETHRKSWHDEKSVLLMAEFH